MGESRSNNMTKAFFMKEINFKDSKGRKTICPECDKVWALRKNTMNDIIAAVYVKNKGWCI